MFSGIATKFNGEKIYKYYSYKEDMKEMFAPIKNLTLRYRHPTTFNDPYDCYIAAKIDGKIQSVRLNQMESVFICSLTDSFNNMLMWTHYASNHEGFVVEYDVSELRKLNEMQMEDFSYVCYSDEVLQRNLFSKNADNEVVNAIYHKASCWCYEKEIRSVVYRAKKQDYYEIKLNDACISGIILGSYFMTKTKGKIPSFLKEWKENNKLFYMQLLSHKYELEKKQDIDDLWFYKDI